MNAIPVTDPFYPDKLRGHALANMEHVVTPAGDGTCLRCQKPMDDPIHIAEAK